MLNTHDTCKKLIIVGAVLAALLGGVCCETAAAHDQGAMTGKNSCREPEKVVDVDQSPRMRDSILSGCHRS